MHRAALLPDLGQHLARCRDEPGVLVAHDEAHTGEAASDQLREQFGPARLGLRCADVYAEQLAVVVGADAVGDERGHVLDRARPPRVDERRVEIQVRQRPDDRRATQGLDVIFEPPRHAAHGRAADALVEQRLGHRGHVARRHARDVRLRDGGVDFGPSARVPP